MALPLAVGAIGSALGSAALGAAGSWFSGKQAADYSTKAYKKRYQWQVQDLKKAGLNPMLAYMNPAPNVPQPNFENIGEGAVKGASAGSAMALMRAQLKNVEADTDLKGSATALNVASAREASIRAGVSEAQLPWAEFTAKASALKLDWEMAKVKHEVQSIAEDIVGKKLTNEQMTKIQPLLVEAQKLINQGMSLDMVQRRVDSQWYEAVGSSDKYGPVLSNILRMIERMTRAR